MRNFAGGFGYGLGLSLIYSTAAVEYSLLAAYAYGLAGEAALPILSLGGPYQLCCLFICCRVLLELGHGHSVSAVRLRLRRLYLHSNL